MKFENTVTNSGYANVNERISAIVYCKFVSIIVF